jgi:hypothetical protein
MDECEEGFAFMVDLPEREAQRKWEQDLLAERYRYKNALLDLRGILSPSHLLSENEANMLRIIEQALGERDFTVDEQGYFHFKPKED